MNSSGGFMWASRFGSSGEDEGHGVAVDYRDNVYITGRFFNTVDFGGGGLTSGGNDDIFSVGFTGGGDYIYSISYGSSGSDTGNAISADGNGDIHITGSIGGNINLGGGIIPAKGGTDAFSLASSPALILPIRLLDFSLEKEGTSVDLSWTLSEVEEGSSFELERGDNPSGFQSIGSFFPSKENCDLCVFNWHDPYLSPGTYYYRLKSIDQDNNTTYSTLLSTVILLEDPDQMKHYFNPYTQSLSIWIQAEKNNLGNISIRNIEGKKVYQFDLLSNGKHEFDLSRYPIGFYILEYSNYSNLEYEKITIY